MSQEKAFVGFTTGLLARLDRTELEGVVAHELAHIRNSDVKLATVVLAIIGTIGLLSELFYRSVMYGGGRRSGRSGGPLLLIGLFLMIVLPVITKLIQLAISREREYLADASAGKITGYPEGLAAALEKISAYKLPDRGQLRELGGEQTVSLFIVNPLRGKKVSGRLQSWLATHPPIDERIRRLRGY